MLYAIEYRDMGSAIHHLVLFKTKKQAETSLFLLQDATQEKDEEIYNELLTDAFNAAIDDIEVNWKDLEEVNEVSYHENNSGMVSCYTDKARIINFNNSIDLY